MVCLVNSNGVKGFDDKNNKREAASINLLNQEKCPLADEYNLLIYCNIWSSAASPSLNTPPKIPQYFHY